MAVRFVRKLRQLVLVRWQQANLGEVLGIHKVDFRLQGRFDFGVQVKGINLLDPMLGVASEEGEDSAKWHSDLDGHLFERHTFAVEQV
jgi:hypothetical protein